MAGEDADDVRRLELPNLGLSEGRRGEFPSIVRARRVHAASVAAPEPHPLYDASKRAIDIVLSLLALLIALPLLILAAAGVLLTTGQNPLLLQRRVGRYGREFSMLKLRTMKEHDESSSKQQVLPGDILVAKTPADERITRIGRLLRRSSMDELPQLVNVLSGQMSLVGPRPGLPIEVAHYPISWQRRLDVKPGITGLWQISGRGEVPAWRRTAMDRYYLRHRSLYLDCTIVLCTFVTLISMRGAW